MPIYLKSYRLEHARAHDTVSVDGNSKNIASANESNFEVMMGRKLNTEVPLIKHDSEIKIETVGHIFKVMAAVRGLSSDGVELMKDVNFPDGAEIASVPIQSSAETEVSVLKIDFDHIPPESQWNNFIEKSEPGGIN